MNLIDMHCDTFWLMMREKTEGLHKNHLAVDIEKMKWAGSLAQFFACFIYMDEFSGEDRYTKAYEHALDMISYAKGQIHDCAGDIALATCFADLQRNREQGLMSAFLTIEEGGILEDDMSRLEHLYQEGIRLMTLTWNHENCIGFPNSRDASVMQKGLKPFGVEVVKRMNQLGMLIDVSHLSDGGFWDVLQYSQKPIVASHSNCRSLCNHPRNLSDEMIRALANQGGVVGINLYPYFVRESGVVSAEDIADHVAHMYQVGGVDVIGIGTDFDGFDEGVSDITQIGQMSLLYDTVKRRGFTERQMEKFWCKNILRLING